MKLSFRNRIAINYMVATALLMAAVFFVVFEVVQGTVWRQLDSVLTFEAEKHTHEIAVKADSVVFKNKSEWEEREHQEIQVNPVFIQLIDSHGRVMDKSPNLKQDFLQYNGSAEGKPENTQLKQKPIRQIQVAVEMEGKTVGYILAAVSSEASISIIHQLRLVLMVAYVLLLFGLYFTSRFIAGRSIIPVQKMSDTIATIINGNMSQRVELPTNKDELYQLATQFNLLLSSITEALQREKQFTSDASHELRTPLATLRGTLEVLIRKPRSQAEYEEKIKYCLAEIDRMTRIADQLLQLARIDAKERAQPAEQLKLDAVVDGIIASNSAHLEEKNLQLAIQLNGHGNSKVPYPHASIILENIISNAIKYSLPNTKVMIIAEKVNGKLKVVVQDEGIGIRPEDVDRVFLGFFRSDALNHKHISGTGLGLAIAKKYADHINAQLKLSSELNKGTTVELIF